ncbi:unnamed protein product [Adineta ricciae]|uniref:Uncharacterized protein n=1 Tax=Adineta ricciae TaxID=249248 RepID=A0A814VNH8_ADIRI|nr:unnamed protein product [Adineta ricciae]CAF1191329.1 unnamed protein product [Adineta ricciae]
MNNSPDGNSYRAETSRQRARSIIREFSFNTSTHGIPGIARSQSVTNRIFWTISTIIFAGVMTYFITESILNFFQYPTQISIGVVDDPTQSFPAVSICNYSPFRYDLFMDDFLNYTNTSNITYSANSTLVERKVMQIQDFVRYKLNRNELVTQYSFTLDNLLIKCTFNNLECSKEDFISFSNALYGNCYTFNAKSPYIRNGSLYRLAENGVWGILKLDLYVHSNQYVPYWSSGIGMIVQIHDNDQIPTMQWKGQYLIPGRLHRMVYTKTIETHLPAPYSDCSTEVPYALQVAFNHFSNGSYAYEQFICATVCIQAYVYKMCGCIDPTEWTARYIAVPGTDKVIIAPVCSENDTCYRKELDLINNSYDLWIENCPICPSECNTVEFTAKLSSLLAPSLWLLDDLKTKVEALGVHLPTNWSTTWQSDLSQNYVGLEVVSETTRAQTLIESASISPVDLLSNVGGQTGLWIGISFLSLMEIAEMIYRLIRSKVYQLLNRNQQPSSA